MALLVGSNAPDFALPDWYDGEHTFSLAAERGHPVVLAFYPGDERLVCTRQMCAYSDNIAELRLTKSVVWGIAPQSVESHRDFAEGRALKMPLLSDGDKAVAGAYGILGALGLRRSVFVIDADGRIAWRWIASLNLTFPAVADLRAVLDALPGAA